MDELEVKTTMDELEVKTTMDELEEGEIADEFFDTSTEEESTNPDTALSIRPASTVHEDNVTRGHSPMSFENIPSPQASGSRDNSRFSRHDHREKRPSTSPLPCPKRSRRDESRERHWQRDPIHSSQQQRDSPQASGSGFNSRYSRHVHRGKRPSTSPLPYPRRSIRDGESRGSQRQRDPIHGSQQQPDERNVNHDRNSEIPRRQTRTMGYRRLADLAQKGDYGEVLHTISDPQSGFRELLDTPELLKDSTNTPKFDWISHITTILANVVSHRGSPETLSGLLNHLRCSAFMKTSLVDYFQAFMTESCIDKLEDYRKVVKSVATVFNTMLDKFPTQFDEIFKILLISKTVNSSVDAEESQQEDNAIQRLLDRCKELGNSRKQELFRNLSEDHKRPPNDFRDISIIPNAMDLESRAFLRVNKKEGSYLDLNHYLDVQFRLMREDFVRPMREGIKTYTKALGRAKSERNTDIRLYKDVRILCLVFTNKGIGYRIRLPTTLKRRTILRSKRLIFGSLLCLSKDNFASFILATVINRDNSLLEQGQIEIMIETNIEQARRAIPSDVFLMAESTAFFESYRPVLEGLKHIEQTFPFQRYIVKAEREVKPPKYVEDNNENEDKLFDLGVLCKVRKSHFQTDILNEENWPLASETELNNSQFRALKAALTKELAIIQGPPGTGKTYLGLKIVRALLLNASYWKPGHSENRRTLHYLRQYGRDDMFDRFSLPPILIVCYTNHALDQFLEGILEFCREGIVRVGSQSKSEKLERFNLVSLRRNRQADGEIQYRQRAAKRELKNIEGEWESVAERLYYSDKGILRVGALCNVIPHDIQHELNEAYRCIDNEHLVIWLKCKELLNVPRFLIIHRRPQTQKNNQSNKPKVQGQDYYDDETENFRKLDCDDVRTQSKREVPIEIKARLVGLSVFIGDDEVDSLAIHRKGYQGTERTVSFIRRNLQTRSSHSVDTRGGSIWDLRTVDKWSLYRHWLAQYQDHLRKRLRRLEDDYQKTATRLSELHMEGDTLLMRTAKILGMTTTGAARYRNALQVVKPRIVIVEEAAEVLEAHIVTTLSEGCQHLILIGDHKQLRPNPTVYELAEKYNMKISLFERLLNNGMSCVTLEEQHRMRPEISRLMEHIYPNLKDHDSVLCYDDVRGIHNNCFFLDHDHPEDNNEELQELKSKSNSHEAKFVAGLCSYLLNQGYLHSQITVLTPYTGQVILLKKEMPKDRYGGIRISAIDDYQGEENNIVVVSLVRSNNENQIGFLKDEHRLCVSLSRAKQGLYVIGNFIILSESSTLWKKMVNTMKANNMFGTALKLKCENHLEDGGVEISKAEDFSKCVPEGGCLKPCDSRLSCGHVCERVCHNYDKKHKNYKCAKDCKKVVCKTHGTICSKKCYQSCESCQVKVDKVVPGCKHTQKVPCCQPPETVQCQEKCTIKFLCGHICPEKCYMHCPPKCTAEKSMVLPCGHEAKTECHQKAKDIECQTKCEATLDCGHKCQGTCFQCFRGRLHIECRKKCGRILVCGHECKEYCHAECPPCSHPCENRCRHSKCQRKCGDLCPPCIEKCTRNCRHKKCSRLCHEPCDRERCDLPCWKILPCGHKCVGLCVDPCPKCIVCDKKAWEDATEVFFGTEEDENARFTQLQECGHLFEVSGLDTWMDMAVEEDSNRGIQMKKCPKCSVVIRRHPRYGPVINQVLCDIEKVKRQIKVFSHGADGKLRERKEELTRRTTERPFIRRLERSSITHAEVDAIDFAIQLLEKINEKKKMLPRVAILNLEIDELVTATENGYRFLKGWARKDRTRISEQQRSEAERELQRLRLYIVLVILCIRLQEDKIKLPEDMEAKRADIKNLLNSGKVITDEEMKKAGDDLNVLLKEAKYPNTVLNLSEKERIELVNWGKENGIRTGAWYKCPKGHIYTIGECGGAMEESKCPECGADIGGTSHRLQDGNTVATIMDGARHAAWGDDANMHNYDLDDGQIL